MSIKLLAQAESLVDTDDRQSFQSLMLGGPVFRRRDRCKEMYMATEGLTNVGCFLRQYQGHRHAGRFDSLYLAG